LCFGGRNNICLLSIILCVVVVDWVLTIQIARNLEVEHKIDIFFPPVSLGSNGSACLEMNFAVLTYFEVKLAYATAVDNAYKEQLMFRSTNELLGEEFRLWQKTITSDMTEGQPFVVVFHSKGSSLGTMARIQSIKLLMQPCIPKGIQVYIFVRECNRLDIYYH